MLTPIDYVRRALGLVVTFRKDGHNEVAEVCIRDVRLNT